MSGFNNDILGGSSTLIRAAIKSPNFVQNVSGWSVNKDGTAQFNSLTITGGVLDGLNYYIDQTGAFFYNGTPGVNKLSASIVPGNLNIADKFGNTCLPGVTTYKDTGTVFIANNMIVTTATNLSGFQVVATATHTQTLGYGVALGFVACDPSANFTVSGNSVSLAGSGANGLTNTSWTNPAFLNIAAQTIELDPGVSGSGNQLRVGHGAFSPTFGTYVDFEGSFGVAGACITSGWWALENQSSAPATQTGQTQLYSDQFSQLHTDRPFQTDDHIEIQNIGAAPGPGGSGAKFWSNTGHANIVSAQLPRGGDSLNYDAERLTLDLPADTASLTNVAATNIPGLPTKTVQAQKYKLRAIILVNQGAAAGTITVNFAGPAVGSGGMGGFALDNSNVANISQAAGLASATITQTNVGRTTRFALEGVVTFRAAGSVSVQARTSNAADPYTVKAGSYWEIEPVVAT